MQGLCLYPDRQEGQSESQRENLSDEPVCEVIWVESLCVGVSGPYITFIAGTRDAPTHTNTDDYFHVKADSGNLYFFYNL